MKKLFYSLLTLAAALSLASCQPDKLLGGSAAAGEGTVNATFCVELGPQTKAFADGTTVDILYAGIYEVSGSDYKWVADNSAAPAAISGKAASVTFNGKIERQKSYKVVFWAQKQGAPYTIDWAKSATSGPTVTVTPTGNANDEARDAFFGVYETGTVTGSIDLTGSPVSLKRPFAQVNILVPNDNIDVLTAAVSSTMSVAQAPTVLNLITKETSDLADWSLSATAISEAAFGSYASTHKYVAMNYVLVDQTAADARYNVTFSVISGTQAANDKAVANVPLKPNGRTNIVGDIFDSNFNITVPIIIDPGANTDQELTTVTVAVGQNPGNAVSLTDAFAQSGHVDIDVAVSHPVTEDADKPEITVDPASVATAEWVIGTGLRVTPLVADGAAVITLVFPAVTKTEYSAATVQIYVKVGTGDNVAATPTFTPGAGEVAAGTEVEIASTTPGAKIYYTMGNAPADPTAQSTLYESPIAITEATTIKAIAIADGFTNSAVAEASYTLAAQAQLAAPVLNAQNAVADQTSIMLDWDDVANATSYAVTYKVKDAAGDATTVTPAPTASEVTITGLNSGTFYTITVQALADGYTASEIAQIDVITEAASVPQKTLESISIAGYTTDYTVGDPFNFDGTVTAIYSDQSTVDVTTSATVSVEPDMTVAADNVAFTISYTEGGSTKTVDGAINVAAAQAQTYAVTLAAMTNGTVTSDKATAAEGETVTLTIAPETNYVLSTITVSKAQGTVDLNVNGNTRTFTMPAEAVTVSATFVYGGQGTQADPYTVAGVRAYIDGNSYNADAQVYVTGVVSELTQYTFAGGTASFWITADGNASDVKFEAYRLNYLGGNAFAAGNPDIALGNSVVLYGKVTNYQGTYETTQNAAYLYSLDGKTAITHIPTITGAGGVTVVPAGDGTLEITLASENGATIYYTLDESTPSNSSTLYNGPFTINAACTIKAIAYSDGKVSSAITSKKFTKDDGSGPSPASYSYTFSSKMFSSTTAVELSDASWTLSGTPNYYGYEDARGQQFGSKNNPATNAILTSSDITGTISTITISASAYSAEATLSVSVDGNKWGEKNLTSSNAAYEFTGSGSGEVVITLTNPQSGGRALYIKAITIQ